MTPWNMQRLAMVLVGVSVAVLVLVGWKGPLFEEHGSLKTTSTTTTSTMTASHGNSPRNLDTTNFDRIFHNWESDMYKRNQLVPLVGREKLLSSDSMIGENSRDGHDLIYLNHSKAFDMLLSAKKSLTNDFYYYQQGWDAQINQAYCGVASSMAVMNSLRGKITLPQDALYEPFPWATQLVLMENECVSDNVYDIDKMEHVFWGLGLGMLETLLNCHLKAQGYKATSYSVDPSSDDPVNGDKIRSIFIHALQDEDTRLLINYDRGGITQGPMGHGHFSPIGAYNDEMDAFLIMDVAKYKYPPVWVPTSKLMGGIGSLDFCSIFAYPEHPFDVSLPWNEIAEKIACQPSFRGYILITKDDGRASEE